MTGEDLRRALCGHDFGMVEQARITGSDADRAYFLDHYIDHTLKWFGHRGPPPALDAFRYFNSGLVLARREPLGEFLAWCEDVLGKAPAHHRVGAHMIADQDYFQFWTNTLHPGSCATLEWRWNHCEHWHQGFPRSGALVQHFSNFCHGPTDHGIARMRDILMRELGASGA